MLQFHDTLHSLSRMQKKSDSPCQRLVSELLSLGGEGKIIHPDGGPRFCLGLQRVKSEHYLKKIGWFGTRGTPLYFSLCFLVLKHFEKNMEAQNHLPRKELDHILLKNKFVHFLLPDSQWNSSCGWWWYASLLSVAKTVGGWLKIIKVVWHPTVSIQGDLPF